MCRKNILKAARARRGAFTMIELIVIVALIGTLAAIVVPRVTTPWTEPPRRILQRAFTEAVEAARNGVSVRFRVGKDDEENKGAVIPEFLKKEEENTNSAEKKSEGTWTPLDMQWKPAGTQWVFDPEIIYFFQDGTCTPAKITFGPPPDEESYLLTVTGYIVENDTE